METASEALDLSRFQVPKPNGGMEGMDAGRGAGLLLMLGLKGTCSCCSWVRDKPRSAKEMKKSFTIDAIEIVVAMISTLQRRIERLSIGLELLQMISPTSTLLYLYDAGLI